MRKISKFANNLTVRHRIWCIYWVPVLAIYVYICIHLAPISTRHAVLQCLDTDGDNRHDNTTLDYLMLLLIQVSIMLKLRILQWRHNGCDSVSNHQPHDCLLNRLFRRRSKKTSKLRVTGFVRGIHRWIRRTNGQLRGKCFHLMTSSWHNLMRHHMPCIIFPNEQ